MLETLHYTIRIDSTPTFLYFDLYLYSAYAAHYVYFTFYILICKRLPMGVFYERLVKKYILFTLLCSLEFAKIQKLKPSQHARQKRSCERPAAAQCPVVHNQANRNSSNRLQIRH